MEPGPYNMHGVWDVHLHPSPDLVPRSQNITEVLADANAAGMTGLVIKSHLGCTAEGCNAACELVRSKVRLVSSITLNESTGGICPEALSRSSDLGSEVVWFPTVSAKHHIAVWGVHPVYPRSSESGISVFNDAGELSDKTEDVLDLIAMKDLVLCSGHISPIESLALFKRAKELGVRRMVFTHVSEEVTRAGLELQRECAGFGVWIEHCFMAATACCPGHISLEQLCAEIRESGVEHVILSSDFGQVENGPIVASFATYLQKIRDLGFADDEIERMVQKNPATLLF